ncbi:MAG: hypothetical protein IJQ20_03070 [Paludibacteraceae bacterium]|nr:hypothetical protein [Paludibacteraceae bacterium]
MAVKNKTRKDVNAASKSTKFSYIITLVAASIVDWAALAALWKAKTGAKLTSKLPLLALPQGESEADQYHTIECKPGTVVPVINAGEAPQDGKAEITAIAEGVDENTLDWAFNMQGEEVVAIVERCSDGKKFLYANPCTGGMTFQYQSIGAQDGGTAGINFTLSGSDCPEPMLVYEPASAPSETPAQS